MEISLAGRGGRPSRSPSSSRSCSGRSSGALAVRTEGIYTIMITLAIASAFFYFTRQNYTIFNGFSGFNAVKPPPLFLAWTGSRRRRSTT